MSDKYRDLFFEETDEYLQTLNDCILDLEKNPEDKDLLDEIFRAAHTLKGMAATMGYETMTKLTHSMENVFDLFKKDEVAVNSDIISLIFRCLDKLSEIVEDLRADEYPEYDISDLLEELDSVGNKKEAAIEVTFQKGKLKELDLNIISKARDDGFKGYDIVVEVDKESALKGARSYLVVNKLEKHGEIISTNPSPEELEEGNYESEFQLIYVSKAKVEDIEKIILNNAEIEGCNIVEIDENYASEASVKTQEHNDLEDSMLAEKIRVEEINETLKNIEVDDKDEHKEKSQARSNNNQGHSIRVDLDRLDSIMNLVSELVIYRTRLEDISNKQNNSEINEPLSHVAKITSELQDLVLKIRMQPVEVALNRFPRMIRDLSKELNKDIELVIEGEDTELDRTVVSELGEPLVHLMRNAADHGIESKEERLALGKPATGLINVTSYQEGNRVIITVSDDGKGLNPEALKISAQRKGIDTTNLTNREVINLIFHPGFSTNESVTSISGRGVGMDVVRSKIEDLGGDIEVNSEVNVGTKFVIKLPLTLSIIQALMVNVGNETFAIPLGNIERIVKLDENQIKKSHSSEVYVERGKAIPLIRVSEKLGLEDDAQENHVILISLGDKMYGLLVNSLIGEQEIVIKKLGKSLSHKNEYLGATILGNGDIVLILDIANLRNEDEGGKYE